MTDGVVFRQVELSDIDAMVAMLNPMYRLKRSKEFLIWQCFKNINPTVLMGAFDGDVIIGMFGIQKRILTNGAVCGQGSWINIRPEYRGRGYFAILGELAIRHFSDLDIVCVFANHSAKTPLEKSLKFQTNNPIYLLINDNLHRFDANNSKCIPIDKETRFECANRIEARNVGFVYFEEYRRWRYAFNPMYSYWLILLETGDFAVVKKFQDPDSGIIWGDIVDFEFSLTDHKRFYELFQAVLSHLTRLGATRATFWTLPEMAWRQVIQNLGFKKSDHKTFFSLLVINQKFEYLYDFDLWNLRQADATNF